MGVPIKWHPHEKRDQVAMCAAAGRVYNSLEEAQVAQDKEFMLSTADPKKQAMYNEKYSKYLEPGFS